MKKINLSINDMSAGMKSLSQQLQANWDEECNLHKSAFANNLGEGDFVSCDFGNGKGIVTMDAIFYEDTGLYFNYDTMASPIKILFNDSSEIELCLNDQCSEIKSNTFVLNTLDRRVKYEIRIKKMIQVRFTLLVIYSSGFLDSIMCDVKNLPFEFSTQLKGNVTHKAAFGLKIRETLNHIRMNDLYDLERKLYVEGHFNTLFAEVLNVLSADEPKGSSYPARDINLIDRASTILDDEYVNPPTVTELAKLVGTNNNKLHRLFKEINGTTINKYVLKKRMEIARGLLIDKTMSVAQISDRIGISSASYFSKKFKETYGSLPSEYLNGLNEN